MLNHSKNISKNNLCQEIFIRKELYLSRIIALPNFVEIANNKHFINFINVLTQNTFSHPLKDNLKHLNSPEVLNNFLLPEFLKHHLKDLDNYFQKDNTMAHNFHDKSIVLDPYEIYCLLEKSHLDLEHLGQIIIHVFEFMPSEQVFEKLDTLHNLPEDFFVKFVFNYKHNSITSTRAFRSELIDRLLKHIEHNFSSQPQECFQYIMKLTNLQVKYPTLKIHLGAVKFNYASTMSAFTDFFQFPYLTGHLRDIPREELPSWLSLLFSTSGTPLILNNDKQIPAFHFTNLSIQLLQTLNLLNFIRETFTVKFSYDKKSLCEFFLNASTQNAYFSDFLWEQFSSVFSSAIEQKQFSKLQITQFISLVHFITFEFENFDSQYFNKILSYLNTIILSAQTHYPALFSDRFTDISKYSPIFLDSDILINFSENLTIPKISQDGHLTFSTVVFSDSLKKNFNVFIETIQKSHLRKSYSENSDQEFNPQTDHFIDLNFSLNSLLKTPREFDTLSNYNLISYSNNKLLSCLSDDFRQSQLQKTLGRFCFSEKHIVSANTLNNSDTFSFLNSVDDYSSFNIIFEYANQELQEKIKQELNLFYDISLKEMTVNVVQKKLLFLQINSLEEYPIQTTSFFKQSLIDTTPNSMSQFFKLFFNHKKINDFYKYTSEDHLLAIHNQFVSLIQKSIQFNMDVSYNLAQDKAPTNSIIQYTHNASIIDTSFSCVFSKDSITNMYLSFIDDITHHPYSLSLKELVNNTAQIFFKDSFSKLFEAESPLMDNSKNDQLLKSIRESLLNLDLHVKLPNKQNLSISKKKI